MKSTIIIEVNRDHAEEKKKKKMMETHQKSQSKTHGSLLGSSNLNKEEEEEVMKGPKVMKMMPNGDAKQKTITYSTTTTSASTGTLTKMTDASSIYADVAAIGDLLSGKMEQMMAKQEQLANFVQTSNSHSTSSALTSYSPSSIERLELTVSRMQNVQHQQQSQIDQLVSKLGDAQQLVQLQGAEISRLKAALGQHKYSSEMLANNSNKNIKKAAALPIYFYNKQNSKTNTTQKNNNNNNNEDQELYSDDFENEEDDNKTISSPPRRKMAKMANASTATNTSTYTNEVLPTSSSSSQTPSSSSSIRNLTNQQDQSLNLNHRGRSNSMATSTTSTTATNTEATATYSNTFSSNSSTLALKENNEDEDLDEEDQIEIEGKNKLNKLKSQSSMLNAMIGQRSAKFFTKSNSLIAQMENCLAQNNKNNNDNEENYQNHCNRVSESSTLSTSSSMALNGSESFDSMREKIYSEVATLISYNEKRPYWLLNLFRELQYLRDKDARDQTLKSIFNIANRHSILSSHSNSNIRRESRETSEYDDDEDVVVVQQQKQKKRVAPLDDLDYLRTTQVQTASQNTSLNGGGAPFNDSLSNTVIFVDNNKNSKKNQSTKPELVNRTTSPIQVFDSNNGNNKNENNRHSMLGAASPAQINGEVQQLISKIITRIKFEGEDDEDDNDSNNYEEEEDDEEIQMSSSNVSSSSVTNYEKFMNKRGVVKKSSNSNKNSYKFAKCDNDYLNEIINKVLKVLGESSSSSAQNHSSSYYYQDYLRMYQGQLSSYLRVALNKYENKRLITCMEDILIDISDILYNELTFYSIMNHSSSTNASKIKTNKNHQNNSTATPSSSSSLNLIKSLKNKREEEEKVKESSETSSVVTTTNATNDDNDSDDNDFESDRSSQQSREGLEQCYYFNDDCDLPGVITKKSTTTENETETEEEEEEQEAKESKASETISKNAKASLDLLNRFRFLFKETRVKNFQEITNEGSSRKDDGEIDNDEETNFVLKTLTLQNRRQEHEENEDDGSSSSSEEEETDSCDSEASEILPEKNKSVIRYKVVDANDLEIEDLEKEKEGKAGKEEEEEEKEDEEEVAARETAKSLIDKIIMQSFELENPGGLAGDGDQLPQPQLEKQQVEKQKEEKEKEKKDEKEEKPTKIETVLLPAIDVDVKKETTEEDGGQKSNRSSAGSAISSTTSTSECNSSDRFVLISSDQDQAEVVDVVKGGAEVEEKAVKKEETSKNDNDSSEETNKNNE